MPWSFMKYVPEVFRLVRSRGFEYECPMKVLRTELKRVTGVVNDKVVSNWLRNLEEMGYIKNKGEFVVELCVDFDRPYEFISDRLGENE